MPYVITCPSCGSKLKSGQRLPVGTRCACPQCKDAFTLSDPGQELPAQSLPRTPEPPPLPTRAAPTNDVPDAILVDETSDQQPASRQRDDDDPPPQSRRRGNAEDDFDDADRTRRNRTRPKEARGPLIALLAGVAALMFLCGGGAALVYFADPFGWRAGGASSDMLAWAPADTQSVVYIDYQAAREVSELRNDTFLTGDISRSGIRPDDIAEVVGANRHVDGPFGMFGEPDVTVIRLKRDADQKAVVAACGGREAQANGKKYYRTTAGGGLYFASDRLLVITKSESTLNGLLQKDDDDVVVSEEMRSAIKRANGTIAFANIGPAAEASDLVGMMAVPGGADPGGPMVPVGSRPRARATVYSIKLSGNKGSLRLESTYDSSESARRVANDLRQNFAQNRTSVSDFDSFDVSRDGATVSLTIDGAIKKSRQLFPFGH